MTRFTADLCSNHNQSLKRTLKLICAAKKAGCWAVKLQLFKANKLYAPGFKEQRKKMKKWEFPKEYLKDVSDYCKELGIKIGCTPFYLEAIEELAPYVDFYKIGSYETGWDELIQKVVDTGKPWQLSTGMIKLATLRHFVNRKMIRKNIPQAVYRCNSTYPAAPDECNMNDIRFCKNYLNGYKSRIGWSDHSCEPGVIYQAVNSGAEFIEFHLDLDDKKGFESSVGHCWAPEEIGKVIHDVDVMKICEFGDNKDYDRDARKWRTDTDGFRPLKQYRDELLKGDDN